MYYNLIHNDWNTRYSKVNKMLESLRNNQFEYQKLSPEEQKARGILGRLYGPIADFEDPTRNGRLYTEELWEQAFDSPLMKEKLENRCLFGELGHPADRFEVDMEKIAICMAERPKKGKDGKLYSVFDILSTPNGKILKALCDYGCNIGVSSRATGDTYEDYQSGQEIVDKDSFECECWDAVLVPAVKEARMKYVNESLENKPSLKEELQKVIDASSDEDRKIMTETLETLKFDGDIASETEEAEPVKDENEKAGNAGDDLVVELQEALKDRQKLQRQVVALQEKLSVSYTKEMKLEQQNTSLKDTVKRLAESVHKSQALSNQLETLKTQLEEQTSLAENQSRIIESYKSKLSDSTKSRRSLKENLTSREETVQALQSQVASLNESLTAEKRSNKVKVESLQKELAELKTDSEVKNSQYAKKLSNCNKLVESYKKTATESISRYIKSKAVQLGISETEIKNRLKENFTFDEIDEVCESLRSYKRNMSKLPFNLSDTSVPRVALKEDASTNRFNNPDDVVDKELLDFI